MFLLFAILLINIIVMVHHHGRLFSAVGHCTKSLAFFSLGEFVVVDIFFHPSFETKSCYGFDWLKFVILKKCGLSVSVVSACVVLLQHYICRPCPLYYDWSLLGVIYCKKCLTIRDCSKNPHSIRWDFLFCFIFNWIISLSYHRSCFIYLWLVVIKYSSL